MKAIPSIGSFKVIIASSTQSIQSIFTLVLGLGLSAGFATSALAQVGELKIINSVTEAGVTEARFDIEVNGQTVPGILWTPEGAAGARPLVLYGHGGSQHKRVSNILRSARDLVVTEHYAVAAIDAPRHGDRAEVETERGAVNHSAEWLATVDALQRLDYVGEGPIGYWGVSMGTSFGVPYVAADERIDVAIFGLFGLFSGESEGPTAFEQAARSIDIPLMFVFQWNDQLMTPQQGLDLYEAFGSEDKVMHINPGGHTGIPVAERESWKPFFVRHLGKAHVRQK